MTNNAAPQRLPRDVQTAMDNLQWSLEQNPVMQYKSVAEMGQQRSSTTTTGTTSDSSILQLVDNIEGTIQSLTQKATLASKETKYLAQIATALLLLGNGYLDEAHNLVLGLSWRGDLPYAYGPSVNLEDETIQTFACYAHCLVHRMEGPHDSEFNMTGFQNSNFWAGNAMRNLEGMEHMPLEQIKQGISELVDSEDAQHFVEKKVSGIFGDWDPRLLTELCQEVVQRNREAEEGETHPMKEFAERAALLELRIILVSIFLMMGFDLSPPAALSDEE